MEFLLLVLLGAIVFRMHANSSRRLLRLEREVADLKWVVRAQKDPSAPPPPARSAEAPPLPVEPPVVPDKEAFPEPARAPLVAPGQPVDPEPSAPFEQPKSAATHAGPAPIAQYAPATFRAELQALHLDKLFDAAKSWLFGGNTVVRVGVVILFFGVAFFLNYAADQGWFPIELRLSAAALVGLGLLAIGWNLRDSRREYALTLQGAGAGIVYLTAFAAVNVYDLIGVGVGLGVMVILVVLGAVLAVAQDARSLAVLATLGGFLGPVLVSRDASHVALFSYYAALDAGIVAVAWFRAWRVLNLLGFVFTFIVGAMWGFEFYQPQYFASTQPFLALFFVFFVAVPVLFAWRQLPRLTGYVDGTLVFGVPLAAFALQSRLVDDFEYGLAYSALVLSVFYAAVAVAIRWRQRESLRLLVESFLALSVVFGTLMIPFAVDGFAVDGRWTSAAWALEGAALVWVGVRQTRSLALMSGLALQFLAGAIYLYLQEAGRGPGDVPVLNIVYLGSLMVSLAGLFSARYLYRHRAQDMLLSEYGFPQLSVAALAWGMLWWFGAGVDEILRHLSSPDEQSAMLGFVAASVVTIAFLRRRLDWKHLAYPAFLLLPVMLVLTGTWLLAASHPLAYWGALAWPVSFLAQYWVLWRLDADWKRAAPVFHCGTWWLGVFLMCWEGAWMIEQLVPDGPTWPFVVWALVPLAVVLCLTRFGDHIEWPVRRFRASYLGNGQLPLVIAAAGWVLVATFHRGDPHPMGYVPFLNPVELVQVCSLGALFWWSSASAFSLTGNERWGGLGVLAFATLNGIIARATHFLGGVPFRGPDLWASAVLQTSLSIAWTVVAFAIMFWATRLKLRSPWLVGAALLAGVVIKLFSVDLAALGTVARIVSFVVVGGLILVIGYVSPLPPKEQAELNV